MTEKGRCSRLTLGAPSQSDTKGTSVRLPENQPGVSVDPFEEKVLLSIGAMGVVRLALRFSIEVK